MGAHNEDETGVGVVRLQWSSELIGKGIDAVEDGEEGEPGGTGAIDGSNSL